MRIRPGDVEGYREWLRANDTRDDAENARVPASIATSPPGPLLTVLLLRDGTVPPGAARMALDSVLSQTYQDWELWIQARSPGTPMDSRIRVLESSPDESVARWFGRVTAAAAGTYLLPVPGFARLSRHAFDAVARTIASDDPDLIYTDEDALNEAGDRLSPRFKTAWDPELMLGRNMVGHLAAFKTERIRELGGVIDEYGDSAASLYDLALRVGWRSDARHVSHIPRVLCSISVSGSEATSTDGALARRIIGDHVARSGTDGVLVMPSPRAPAWARVIWPVPTPAPLASVIVPTRDQPAMLSRCVQGVLDRTDYAELELLIVDNGSSAPDALGALRELQADRRVRVIRHDAPFNFSQLSNLAAREADGEVLVLLNDDTEVIEGGWLRELVSQALRPEVGVVGARLLYPDGTVQHAGIVLESGKPHHQFRLCDAGELGPIGELALTRSVSAVTGACLAIRRSVFEEAGGLDENLAVAFGDVDLCLRVADRGYRVICTPFAELYHHESATRGYEDSAAKQTRMEQELSVLRARWAPQLRSDRFANPNLLFTWDATGSWGLPRPAGRRAVRGGSRAVAIRVPAIVERALDFARAHVTGVVPNPLFSSAWYLAAYPEVRAYRLGPYRHYRRHGVREGRNPNPLFDTLWYLDHYPDVAAGGMDPLDHYLRVGASEGRDPSPEFSTRAYLEEHPEVRKAGGNPLLHCLQQRGF